MIYEVLSEISELLNQYFKMRFGIAEDKLIISNLVNNDGTEAVERDRVVLSLVGLQEEKMLYNRVPSTSNPPVSLYLYILFSTTFYGNMASEGLKFISEIIGFFQADNVFELEGNKVIFEIHNLDFGMQNNLWASIGAKYTPSVLYKAAMVTIDESMPPASLSVSTDFPE